MHPAPMLLVLVFRWFAFAWMAIVAALGGQVREDVAWLAVVTLVGILGWTAWLTLAAIRRPGRVLAVDLLLAVALVLASGYFHPVGHVLTNHPSVAGVYPMTAVAAWAVMRQITGGSVAGGVVAAALPFAYVLNGVPLHELSFSQQLQLIGTALSYPLLGAVIGTAARQFGQLTSAVARNSERAARERIAADIHDDVLQRLAQLRRQGSDLADRGDIRPAELLALLAEMGRQENALRGMVEPDPPPPPHGSVSLSSALGRLAGQYREVAVHVLASGPLVLPQHVVSEVVAAVAAALSNVVEHANAEQTWISALDEGNGVMIFVRDDGVGFEFDSDSLHRAGRLGLRVSVRSRIERIGGKVTVRSRPGHGTEIELWVP
jgi:signal transduction histidine kinase